MCGKLSRMQQTVSQSFPNTLRSSPSRVHTTCSCARPGDRPLEAIAIRACRKFCTTSQGLARWGRSLSTNFEKASDKWPQPPLLGRTPLVQSSTNWQSDSRNFHESARAVESCLQNRDVSHKTDQSMIEAVKCMFHKLLGEASDDLECVTPQSHESLHAETTRYNYRCSRPETSSDEPCPRPETSSDEPCPRPETSNNEPCLRSETLIEKPGSRKPGSRPETLTGKLRASRCRVRNLPNLGSQSRATCGLTM